MDIITDLTAQAVSYVTILQDICKKKIQIDPEQNRQKYYAWEIDFIALLKGGFTEKQIERISEIVWVSPDLKERPDIFIVFITSAKDLLNWIRQGSEKLTVFPLPDMFDTPFIWRKSIRAILYAYPEERLALVKILRYMPLQVVLSMCRWRPGVYKQRLYQVYVPDKEAYASESLMSEWDKRVHNRWWGANAKGGRRLAVSHVLLLDLKELQSRLKQQDVPLPFDSLFNDELQEIRDSRRYRRLDEESGKATAFPPEPDTSPDPLLRAEKMELYGLAFSGGGIRSATFNLGILQKLAEFKVLSRFDYISTVSGGGYIGSWFTSWIKRSGSVGKVSDRLDSRKSADPLAEEVRPVRWLRMFSNYLSPEASIMSADAWTVGITWLRNTLINQLILLLALLTALSLIAVAFQSWRFALEETFFPGQRPVWIIAGIVLSTGCLLAGTGMRAFGDSRTSWSMDFGRSKYMSKALVCWSAFSAVAICLFFSRTIEAASGASITGNFRLLALPCIVSGTLGMWLIALLGNYHKYPGAGNQADRNFYKRQINQGWHPWKLYTAIFLSAPVAAAAGTYLLALGWHLIRIAGDWQGYGITDFGQKLQLILGVPVILEVLSLTVVLRMMFMGSLFPDDRREWWGRMGAMTHRLILLWLLTTAAALILPELFKDRFNWFIQFLGGWSVIIGTAVRLAFTSTKEEKSSGGFSAKEYFIRFAPYLFMLGSLLIGAYLLEAMRSELGVPSNNREAIYHCSMITLSLGLLTFLLSWRIGVNEFSLHFFYRNRLVRAYLGATRRRTERERSANNFTGFDAADDIPLCRFSTQEGYIGPMPLVNTSLNASVVSDLDRQDRKAESFVFSPLYCGYDFSPTRSSAFTRNQVYEYGYRPTAEFSGPGGPLLGTAMAISGAAVNPNQGYHSSSAMAFLLTVFNLRLGWWIGNTRLKRWRRSDPRAGIIYLFYDLFGRSNINTDFVCLSDGGHFDNMGIYELIRRRCTYILLCDAEEDSRSTCEGLANAVRRCRIDMGVEITIDLTKILDKDKDTSYVKAHTVKGSIRYPGDVEPSATIVYVKTSLTGNEPVDVREYHKNNADFPQQSTGDQFFDEAQFESYRKLGHHSIGSVKQLHFP